MCTGVNFIKPVRFKQSDKLEFIGEFEDEFCTGALHSPHGEGGPPVGGG